MLNLLRSDLYRMTRPRGARGELISHGIVALAIPLGVTIIYFIAAFISDGGATITNGSGLYSELLGLMFLNTHMLPLLTTFTMVQVTIADIENGYEKTLSSAIKGTGSRLVERIALAGIVAGVLTLVAAAGTLATGAIITMGNLTIDPLTELIPWLFALWLTSWAYALPPLVFALFIRNKTAAYSAGLYASVLSSILFAILSMASQLLRTPVFTDAFTALAPYFPGHVIELLSAGAATVARAGDGAFALAGGAGVQAVAVFALWLAISIATGLAVAHRRRG